MDKKEAPVAGELMLEINQLIEGGVYSNAANIIHNKNEFILDFAIVLPGKNAARVQSRIITNPVHAKQLMLALQNNISKYEQSFGEIKIEAMQPILKAPETVH
ncbi:MAG: DUF3467 domain-containing protein [Nitrospinae bacterium]|nr:DUF3467 domain-containing protein [Nitrospinota bacterium]MBI3814985.1 DUF3467 domain-containing protein [Nitrospinota bacterium]